MKNEELNSILRLHKAWLIGEDGGERANLQCSDLKYADLRYANLDHADLHGANLDHANLDRAILDRAILDRAILDHTNLHRAILQNANLQGVDLRRADLRGADLRHSDLRGADIDYSSWPLWCGSLKAYVDDRIAIQLLYHTLSVVQYSPYVSEEVKKALLSAENVRIANRFHRVGQCGEIKEWEEGTE